jgi:hypothetical protein
MSSCKPPRPPMCQQGRRLAAAVTSLLLLLLANGSQVWDASRPNAGLASAKQCMLS